MPALLSHYSGLSIPTGLSAGSGLVGGQQSFAAILAGANTDVMAASTADNSLVIRDTVTPANNYSGPLYNPATGLFNKGTFTRASVAYEMVNGVLTSFATGKPRFKVANGLTTFTVEDTATNLCLWSRDWTNAAWVKTTMGTALNATGIDGAANSATTLTASGGLAMALQTIVTSTTDVFSVWVKRITGSGTIEITQNGGTAWTTIVPTANWTRFAIPAAALVNPAVGVRITTNGDAVAVDFAQLETNGFATSNILTVAASATRSGDDYSFANSGFNLSATAGTLYAKYSMANAGTNPQIALSVTDGTTTNRMSLAGNDGGTNSQFVVHSGGVLQANSILAGVVSATIYKGAGAYAASDFRHYRNAVAGNAVVSGTVPATTKLAIGAREGGNVQLFGDMHEFMYVARAYSNGELTVLTT